MSWVATAIVATSVVSMGVNARSQKKAAKKGREEALADQRAARKAEVFAETEGEGVGGLGKIALAVDKEIDEEEELLRVGKSKVVVK